MEGIFVWTEEQCCCFYARLCFVINSLNATMARKVLSGIWMMLTLPLLMAWHQDIYRHSDNHA